MPPCPELVDIGEGAAEVFIVCTEDLGCTAALGTAAARIFDGVHEGEGLRIARGAAIGQRDAVVPAFKKAARGFAVTARVAPVPVVAAVGRLESASQVVWIYHK